MTGRNVDVNASGCTTGWSAESCRPASHQPGGPVAGSDPSPPPGSPRPLPGGEVVLSSEGMVITVHQGQVWFFVNLK